MEAKKKIMFFIQNGVGGAERMTVNIAKILPKDEYDIFFCKVSFPYTVQDGRIEDFIPNGIKIINIFWANQIGFIRQIYNVLKKYQPDVVFSSVMPYNQRLLLFKPLFKDTRFVVRNDNYLFTISRLKQLALKYTYKNADLIVAQTEEMKDELEAIGLPAERIKVLHNLIDEDLITAKAQEPSPFPDDNITRFVAVGRVARQKGYDILIDAFKIVREKLPESELYIIGNKEGSSRELYTELWDKMKSLDLDSKIHFVGYTDNPYRYIKNASAYVLSSRFEGLPNVLIEAQFLKTPSAATKCIPIISRMIHDGENGFLAESENPESLAEAMIKAVGIKDVKSVYKPSSRENFISIF